MLTATRDQEQNVDPEKLKVVIDPELLPPVFSVKIASQVLGIGKNATYQLIKDHKYPVRVRVISGRLKVSRYDLLAYLGAGQPGSPS